MRQTDLALVRVIVVMASQMTHDQRQSIAVELRALEGSDTDRQFYASTANNIENYDRDLTRNGS